MIIWRGWGFAVVGICIASIIVSLEVAQAATGLSWKDIPDKSVYNGISFLLMAIMTFLLNFFYINKRKERVIVDAATGQTIILRHGDSLFFIPLRFWPVIFGVVAIGHFLALLF